MCLQDELGEKRSVPSMHSLAWDWQGWDQPGLDQGNTPDLLGQHWSPTARCWSTSALMCCFLQVSHPICVLSKVKFYISEHHPPQEWAA